MRVSWLRKRKPVTTGRRRCDHLPLLNAQTDPPVKTMTILYHLLRYMEVHPFRRSVLIPVRQSTICILVKISLWRVLLHLHQAKTKTKCVALVLLFPITVVVTEVIIVALKREDKNEVSYLNKLRALCELGFLNI